MIHKEKHLQYAAIITAKINELLNEDDNFDKSELLEDDNLTHFIHALANIAPNYVYNKITGDDKNNLEFNHIANHLIFQYSKSVEE